METLLPQLKSVLLPIAILGFIVLVHEAAHFLAALKVRIKVIEFSVFIGPAIWSRVIGGIKYSLRIIPFGGYVRIFGMELDEPNSLTSPEAFHNRPISHRLLMLLSGSLANLLSALVLFFIFGLAISGIQTTNVVAKVALNMPAAKAGVRPKDEIVGIDRLKIRLTDEWLKMVKQSKSKRMKGVMFKVVRDGGMIECDATGLRRGDILTSINGIGRNDGNLIISAISSSPGRKISVTVKRGEKFLKLSITPIAQEEVELRKVERTIPDQRGGLSKVTETEVIRRERGIIGVEFLQATLDKPIPLLERISDAIKITFGECVRITYGLVVLFAKLGQLHHAVGGPIRIFWELKEQAWISFYLQLRLIGILSYIVGVLNLIIPIPPLDGGRIALLCIEAITRQRINPRWELWMTVGGVVVLLSLILFISARDIGYIIKRIAQP